MGNKILSVSMTFLAFGLWLWAMLSWNAVSFGARIWMISFFLMMMIRLPYIRQAKQTATHETRRGLSEKYLLIAMFGSMMVLPMLHLATGCFAFADYHLGFDVMLVGAVLQIPYLILFWRAHADLGKNWSPGLEVRETHTLVTQGVYTYLRHPMYAAIWIAAVSQPLLVQNWIAGALILPSFAAMWFIRVPQEEAMMRDTFGPDYDAYCAHAGRLLPHLGR